MDAMNKRVSRREALGILGAAGAALTVACGDSPVSPTTVASAATTTTTTGGTSAACAVTPNETAGPFPSLADFVRSDIREGRPGLALTLAITVVNTSNACAPVAGAQVEIWQCDADGNYSQYGTERSATYLRGIQASDAGGRVTFTTIYPGWYQGRATHIHVEVTQNGRVVKTTQIAFPEDVTAAVYRTGVYASGGQNPTTNSRDGIFSDGVSSELVSLAGDTSGGYTGTFQVGVAL